MSGIKASVIAACRRILAPLTRILIRFGVSAGELSALVEQEYVRSAAQQLAQRGELVTASRLAVITGLPRNIVPSIVASLGDESPRRVGSLAQRAQRVVDGWFTDRQFLDAHGNPTPLPVSGAGRSFETLVDRYAGGGVRASTVLKDLAASRAVRLTGKGELRVVRRSAAAGGADPATIQQLGEVTAALLATLERNLTSGPAEQLPIHAVTREARHSDVPTFRAQAGTNASGFIERTEAALEKGQRNAPPPEKSAADVLLGAFVFTLVQPMSSPAPRWQKGLAARLKEPAATSS
jgi:hypothetical protein